MKSMRGQLPHRIADADLPGLHDLRVDTAQAQLASNRRVHELHGVDAEPRDKLATASMRLRGHLDDRRSDGQPRSRRQVGGAEVEVNDELIAGKWPAVWRLRHEGDGARVDDVQLHVGMRPAIE